MVFGDALFEEVLFFGEVLDFAHPREGVGGAVLGFHAEAFEAAVGDVLDVVAEEGGVEAEDAARHAVLGVGDFEADGLADHVADFALVFGGPDAGVFVADAVDEVNAEVEVDGFVAHDVFELLADADHFVLAFEGEEHDEAGVEEDAFHDDVKADEVFEEVAQPLGGGGAEAVLDDVFGEAHFEGVFVVDGVDFVIHVEDFALVEGEGFDDVVEGVGVDGFFEGLAQEVLAAFRVGDVFEDGQDDVVADEGFGGGEEAEVAHDDVAFFGGEAVGFPEFDVGTHGDFVGHPVVGAAFEVVVPGPVVFDGHELVDVDGGAVDEAFVVFVDALGEVVECGACGGGGAAGHILFSFLGWFLAVFG